jgi:C4-dicarboxylate-specific signal transduction histidine kinase
MRELGQIRDLQDQMLEAERLRLLMETAGGAAHEISQPLTAIFGAIHELRRNPSDQVIRNELDKAARRINEIVKGMQEIREVVTKP